MIKHIEGIENLRSLVTLSIQKNKLTSTGVLGVPPPYKKLKILELAFNEIPLEYLDELCLAL